MLGTPVLGTDSGKKSTFDGVKTNGVLLLLFIHQVVSNSLQPHGLQHAVQGGLSKTKTPFLKSACTNTLALSPSTEAAD